MCHGTIWFLCGMHWWLVRTITRERFQRMSLCAIYSVNSCCAEVLTFWLSTCNHRSYMGPGHSQKVWMKWRNIPWCLCSSQTTVSLTVFAGVALKSYCHFFARKKLDVPVFPQTARPLWGAVTVWVKPGFRLRWLGQKFPCETSTCISTAQASAKCLSPFALFRRSTFTGEACPFLEPCMFFMAGVSL